MARQQEPSAGRQRLVALAATGGLAAATAFAFGRVFVGRAPTWQLVGAALASLAIAGLCERRGLVVALLASAAGLAFALTWIVYTPTAWYGLPSPRTLRAVGRSLELVAEQVRVQVAPTAPLRPLLLAAVTAAWTSAFSSHALAIRAGSPLLAVLPSVALVGFADTVLEDGARSVYAITFLLAALAVVFVDGLRRVRQWGPIWSSMRHRGLASVASRGARLVAVIAVIAAVIVPGLLPGFRSAALVDFSTSDAGIRLDPFVSIHSQLEENEAVDLFEVTSSSGPAYWRLYALDRFDGATWSSSDPDATEGQILSSPARLPRSTPIPQSASEPLAQRYRVLTEIADPWLPMAYAADSLTLPSGEIRFDADLGAALLDGGLEEGLEYSVQSRLVVPDPTELDLIRFDPASDFGRYTFVPEDVDPRVLEIARRWTEGESSPYRQVLALQRHFTDGSFVYDQDVEPETSADALVTFLEEDRRGFCQQFATAMALMVRELGYPSRVAVGYRSGELEGDTYLVRNRDAHAWVEVYFPGMGWLSFEPTPGRPNPLAEPGSYLNPVLPGPDDPADGSGQGEDAGSLGGDSSCPGSATLPGQQGNADPRACNPIRPERGGFGADLPPGFFGTGTVAPEEVADRSGYSIPYRWILLVLAAAGGLLLLVVPAGKWLGRRRMLRRSLDPRARVLAAYRVFDGRAADLGLGRRDGETLEEHRARVTAGVALSDGHLARLAGAAEHAAYAPSAPSRDEADEAVHDARTSIGDLRRDAGLLRRLIGTYRPGL
ncbi:MAG: transglutaminase family protein [Actinomycetota bacterium]